MEIIRLSDRPQCAAQTAALMIQIWPSHYGPGGAGCATTDVQSRIAEDRAAIAKDKGVVIGTVAISDDAFGAKGEGPWLVGLCAAPDHRGRGVASALITWAMGLARKQGRPALFTTTRDAHSIVARLGWREVREIKEETGVWSVWRVDLTDGVSA